MACFRVDKCPLFAQFKMKSSLRFWQTYYCEQGFDQCERYKLAKDSKPVPLNLLPNGRLLAVPLEELEPKHLA